MNTQLMIIKLQLILKKVKFLMELLVEQQRYFRQESFKHKIKYFDRFSDGYVEIAEALLDPIGNNKYLIHGRSLDHNPNS